MYDNGRPRETQRFQLHLAPTVVKLPRRHNAEAANRILRELAEFYPVTLSHSSVQIAVDRGRAAEAPLRVATILDDIDKAWEEHFHLPQLSAPRLWREPRRLRRRLPCRVSPGLITT